MSKVVDRQKGQSAGRRMSVITRRAGTTFNRGGCAFSWQPVSVREHLGDHLDSFDPIGLTAEVCGSTFDRILGEPMLVCTLQEEGIR